MRLSKAKRHLPLLPCSISSILMLAFTMHLGQSNVFSYAGDGLAIGIFWLHVAKLGLITHLHVPFAEGKANLCLVEHLDAHPLSQTALAQNPPPRVCTLERVLQQRILIHPHHTIAALRRQKLTCHSSLV